MIDTINSKLEIIQGDTFYREIEIEGVSNDLIESIYFSCNELNICKSLTYDSNVEAWVLQINSNETDEFAKFNGTYDLTIKFSDQKITTVVYNGLLIVKEKQNKVRCYG